MRVDLNADLGESFGHYRLGYDAELLRVVTSANIACGFHAGDPRVMRHTVSQVAREGVAVGAHPGYPDVQGFGQRIMDLSDEELENALIYQLGALGAFARIAGAELSHVKPHGALYDLAARDGDTAAAIARAVITFNPRLVVVTSPGSTLRMAALSEGLRVAQEGFAHRAYRADGSLVPPKRAGAFIDDAERAAERAVRMVTQGEVETVDGRCIPLQVDTLCVHGDAPEAVSVARAVRSALEAAGVELAPLSQIVGG